ncbi:hypothetical protein BDD12DRAFT_825492, partial [Trichophaea hybrida]
MVDLFYPLLCIRCCVSTAVYPVLCIRRCVSAAVYPPLCISCWYLELLLYIRRCEY